MFVSISMYINMSKCVNEYVNKSMQEPEGVSEYVSLQLYEYAIVWVCYYVSLQLRDKANVSVCLFEQ